jgi:hypothetical protein
LARVLGRRGAAAGLRVVGAPVAREAVPRRAGVRAFDSAATTGAAAAEI